MAIVYIKKKSNFVSANTIYQKTGNTWTEITYEQLMSSLSTHMANFGGIIPTVANLSIAAPDTVVGKECQCQAVFNTSVVTTGSGAVWSVVSGGTYATIDQAGLITIDTTASASPITVQVGYNAFGSALTATHNIVVTYDGNSESETEVIVDFDESGNTITTTSTTVTNEDGSSQSESVTVVTDESGNTIQTTESTTNNNSDGSYDSTSTTYDENGDPTETINASGDTNGNVNTQGIEYENGEPVVTGYTIDTSDNPDGEKTYNGDGVNTEYYAFDLTHGFVLHIHFTINFNQQPPGQNENHHNILTMKRATPSPWYGFQIRQTGTNKYVQLGTQFSTGSNTNTQIPSAATASANTAEYDLTITYNPTASTNSFVCRNNLTSTNVYTSNNKFPDVDDLKYLKVTIGYAMDENGNPFRYSNINVLDFSLQRT